MIGWRQKLLDVNLTDGEIQTRPLSRETCRQTIGGIGLAAQLIFDSVPPEADPLGPDNVLVIASGPLGGTTWAGTGRVELAARSPLTGLWGESSMGGYFGTQLKRAGYDALAIHGTAPEPVILVIDEGEAYLTPADAWWGKDTYTTLRGLQARYPNAEVMAIGPAGEARVPMASIVHNEGNNIAARCGMGAVAGSKRLKAIVARGTQPVPLADAAEFNALKRAAIGLFLKHGFLQGIRRGKGTAGMTEVSIAMGDLPVRNWDMHVWDWRDAAMSITGEAMQTLWPEKKDTCYACPIGCKWRIEDAPLRDGGRGHLAGPEYESIAGLGAMSMITDPLAVIQAADLCNSLGIDTISTGASIAWAVEAFEHGILTEAHTDGLKLKWGDPAQTFELIHRMAENRPGIGALLAQGTKKAAAQIGGGAEFAIHVKGLELPYHHPRALRGLEIAYATLPRGATHNEEGAVPDQGKTYEAWIAEIISHMDLSGANTSMVYCQFLAAALDADYTADLLTATTGEAFTPDDLYRVGARTWYLRRAFNLRLGVGLDADELPKRILKQIKADANVSLADFDRALQEFYKQRALDARGVPSAEMLASLGLDFVLEELA